MITENVPDSKKKDKMGGGVSIKSCNINLMNHLLWDGIKLK